MRYFTLFLVWSLLIAVTPVFAVTVRVQKKADGTEIIEGVFRSTGLHYAMRVKPPEGLTEQNRGTLSAPGDLIFVQGEPTEGSTPVIGLEHQPLTYVPGTRFDLFHYKPSPIDDVLLIYGEKGPHILTDKGVLITDFFTRQGTQISRTTEIAPRSTQIREKTILGARCLYLSFRYPQANGRGQEGQTYLLNLDNQRVSLIAEQYYPNLNTVTDDELSDLVTYDNSSARETPRAISPAARIGREIVVARTSRVAAPDENREGFNLELVDQGIRVTTPTGEPQIIPADYTNLIDDYTHDPAQTHAYRFGSRVIEAEGHRYLAVSMPYRPASGANIKDEAITSGETYLIRDDGVLCRVGYFHRPMNTAATPLQVADGIVSFTGGIRRIDLRAFVAEAGFMPRPMGEVKDDEKGDPLDIVATVRSFFHDGVEEARLAGPPRAVPQADAAPDSLDAADRDLIYKIVVGISGFEYSAAAILGPAGTGKTYIVEKIMGMIARGEVANVPRTTMMPVLDRNSLGAGTKYIGKLETRVKALLEMTRAVPTILVADEVHALEDVGKHSAGNTGVLQMLKPQLARGLRAILMSTTDEFNHAFQADTALMERIQKTYKSEPGSRAELQFIMRNWAQSKGVPAPAVEGMELIESLSRTLGHGAQPRRSILLLDRVYAVQRAKGELFHEPSLAEIRHAASLLYAIGENNFDRAYIAARVANLRRGLDDRIIGHGLAKDVIVNQVRRAFVGVNNHNRPAAFILLAGAKGVGKTQFGYAVAAELERPAVRIQMNEFNAFNIDRLKNEIAQALNANKQTVFILDEIEGADPAVQDVLIGIRDTGELKMERSANAQGSDLRNVTYDTRKAFFIATSNAGAEAIEDLLARGSAQRRIGFEASNAALANTGGGTRAEELDPLFSEFGVNQEQLKRAISEGPRSISAKLVNRFDAIGAVGSLNQQEFAQIVGLKLRQIARELSENSRYNGSEVSIDYLHLDQIIDVLGRRLYRRGQGFHEADRILNNVVRDAVTTALMAGVSAGHMLLLEWSGNQMVPHIVAVPTPAAATGPDCEKQLEP